MSKKTGHTGYRDNDSGEFVTKKYGESHPKSTTKETIPNPGRGDTGRGGKR